LAANQQAVDMHHIISQCKLVSIWLWAAETDIQIPMSGIARPRPAGARTLAGKGCAQGDEMVQN